MTLHYHLAGNLPGYMSDPDSIATFPDFWSALDGLVDELRRQADDLYQRTGLFGDPLDPDLHADLVKASRLIEEEGDRVNAAADALESTLRLRQHGHDPAQVRLGTSPDDLWPVSMARNGISFHVDTDPDSDHHLGWNIHVEPCVEDCDLTDLDLED